MIHKAIKISTGLDWNKDRFQKDVQSYKDGTELWIDVTDKKPSKTLQQIRYIHVLFGYIAAEKGISPDLAKATIKKYRGMFKDYVDKKDGNIIRVFDSCKDFNIKEAEEFIEHLLYVCEFLNIKVIPIEEYFET